MPNDPVQLEYSTPPAGPSYAHKVWAGSAIMFAGLGLVVLGGCFLIGVLWVTNNGPGGPPRASLTPPVAILVCVLYVMAFLSFLVAGWVIFRGMQALLKIMRA